MNAPFTPPDEEPGGRFHCLTEKVRTPMGPVFVHVDLDSNGQVFSVRFDQAQKFEPTAIGELLDSVGGALNRLIVEGKK